jgi:hypothetical protein
VPPSLSIELTCTTLGLTVGDGLEVGDVGGAVDAEELFCAASELLAFDVPAAGAATWPVPPVVQPAASSAAAHRAAAKPRTRIVTPSC